MVLNGLYIGPASFKRLMEYYGNDPVAILQADYRTLMRIPKIRPVVAELISDWQSHFNLSLELELLDRNHCHFIAQVDEEYPKLLKEIYDPPVGLYVMGNYDFSKPSVAIIGTRRASRYGRDTAHRFSRELCLQGAAVVSGMALGIDTAAHQGAIEAGGPTVAVLACGIDIIYPPENHGLYKEISKFGAVVTELPFGRKVDRQAFPLRNRIVSGLCEATIVVESNVKGGSMITAGFAGEQGRHLFAVPGRVDHKTSEGCHQLIRDGAILLTGVQDIFEELDFRQMSFSFDKLSEPSAELEHEPPNLSRSEKLIYEYLKDGARLSPDFIAVETRLPIHEVTANLLMLELKHVISKDVDGSYEIRG